MRSVVSRKMRLGLWGGSIDQLDLTDELKEFLHKWFGASPQGGNSAAKACSIQKLLSKRVSDITMLPGGLIIAPIINTALYNKTGQYITRLVVPFLLGPRAQITRGLFS